MAKKTKDPSSLGEVVAGRGRGSLDGMKRLASAHPGVRYVVDVVELWITVLEVVVVDSVEVVVP